MKRLVVAVVAIVLLFTFTTTGCAEKEPVSPTPGEGEEVVSSCATCHRDKETLKEVASPEPEEVQSEATTGEG